MKCRLMNGKRWLSLVLAVSLVLGNVPFGVFAEENAEAVTVAEESTGTAEETTEAAEETTEAAEETTEATEELTEATEATEAVSLAEDHVHDYQPREKAPTCTEPGYRGQVCTTCGDVQPDPVTTDITAAFQWTDGAMIQATSGKQLTDSNWMASDYVDISGCDQIRIITADTVTADSTIGLAFYDESKTYVSGVRHTDSTGDTYGILIHELTVPEKAVYIRSTWYSQNHPGYDSAFGAFSCSATGDHIPATGHSYALTGHRDATCSAEGAAVYTCGICGHSYEEALPKGDHSFDDGVCTLCDYSDPEMRTATQSEDTSFRMTLTPGDYLTVSRDETEKLACAPGLVALENGKFAVSYLADDTNTVETESSTTIVCRLGFFDLKDPEQGTFFDVAKPGQTIGGVTIGNKAPYEPNLLKLSEKELLVLFNIRDTSGNYIYYSARFDTGSNTVTAYQPLTLDGAPWTPANIAASYNALAQTDISTSGPAGSMVFTSQIIQRGGYYYGYCGGICAGFSGILVRSTDGINWTSVMVPEALPEMAGVIECGIQFLDDYVYFCMRDISSGVYHCSYDITTGEQMTGTVRLSGLTTSKPAAFTQDGKLYLIVNKATGDDSTVGRRNTALFYRVDPATCRLSPARQVFCADGVAYHSVVNMNGANYWCFHTDARRINPYTQGRSNLAFRKIPALYTAENSADGVLNLQSYSHMYAQGCITVSTNTWQAGAVNMHYQIPLADFAGFDTVTVTANGQNKAYLAFFTDWMSKEGGISYAEGWTEQLILEPGTSRTLPIPENAQYLYILATNAAGESLLPASVQFRKDCDHSYENGSCTQCGAKEPDADTSLWPQINTDLTHIVAYGQSFSTGADAPVYPDPAVDGVYVLGGITNSKGDTLSPIPATGSQHPIISAVNVLARLLKGQGIETDIIAGSYGTGGKTIAQLMSDTRQAQIKEEEGYDYDILSSGRYGVFQQSVEAVAEYARQNGQTVSCPAIVYLQGETDQNTDAQLGYPDNPQWAAYAAGGDKEKYKLYMTRLKEDMQKEVMESYGQTEKPLFLIYQVSGTYVRTQYSTINMAQLEFARENEDVILVQTPYFTPHYTNSHHLTVNGYRWLGEYIGRSMYTALTRREKTWPLLPKAFTVEDAGTLRITLSGAEKGLTVDTWTVEDASNGSNLYGFYLTVNGSRVVPKAVTVEGSDILLTLPENGVSLHQAESVFVYYAGQGAKGTGNIRDNCTETGYYSYLDDSADTGTGNNQGVSYSALDETGNSLIGQPYPLYNWLASFCYEIRIPERQPAFYHWEMQEAGLTCVSEAENPLTLQQGSVENGVLMDVQYSMAQSVALYHNRPWAIEWKTAGNGTYGGGMLLAAADGSGSKAGGLYLPADSRGLVAWNVSSESSNFGIKLTEKGIDTRQEHTYRIENRIASDGTNTLYLLVDGVEMGDMNTPFSTVNGAQGESKINWANGADIYLHFLGKPTAFLLKNMKLSYLKIWEDTHTHVYTAAVTAPTCTELGFTTHTCSICGKTYKDTYAEAKGHTWLDDSAVIKECTDCGTLEGGYRIRVPGDSVWIDGVEFAAREDKYGKFVRLEHTDAETMVVYSYNDAEASNPHTRYPTGMRVWRLAFENGGYGSTRMPELEDMLQYAGASIRVTGVKGIRMITGIDKALRSSLMDGSLGYRLLEYGTCVAWASDLGGTAPVLGQGSVMHNFAYKRDVADPIFADTGGTIQYTNVLVGFTDDQLGKDLVLRPYMILEDAAGEQITLYGGCVTRSIGYIAKQNESTFPEGTKADAYIEDIISKVYG